VPLVKLELLTLPEQSSSPLVVSGVGVTQSLVLFVGFVLLSFLLLAIVLSALRFMDSDYPFGIFKLLLIKGLMEN
jgi:type III secretory pathway component EscV